MRKETEDQTRKRIEKNLRNSATDYADHAENTISKLQQTYSKKYHPDDHGLQYVPNKKFGVKDLFRNRRELDRPESEESGAPRVSPIRSSFVSELTLTIRVSV